VIANENDDESMTETKIARTTDDRNGDKKDDDKIPTLAAVIEWLPEISLAVVNRASITPFTTNR
jgi:hypothetical protein